MKDKFDEFSCDFKSPEQCAEELEEDGLNPEEVELNHYGEPF